MSGFSVQQRIISTLCKLRYTDALPAFEEYYDTHIKDWPLVRAEFAVLQQSSVPLAEVRIGRFPKKSVGLYMPVGGGQSAIPSGRGAGSACGCCGECLIELVHVPAELVASIAPDGLGVFHCERCIYHSPLFLQHQGCDAPSVIAEPSAEVLSAGDQSENEGTRFDIAALVS